MKVRNVYPLKNKNPVYRDMWIRIFRWPFLVAIYVCPILNLILGGPAWSVIVLWGLWMLWSFFVSPYVIEYNRLSQFVKLITNASIMLVLIKLLIAPMMPLKVIPIVGFAGVILIMILFVTDLKKQQQNLFPLLVFIIAAIILSVVGLIIWQDKTDWTIIVLIMTSFASLISTLIILKKNLWIEFKKRFSLK